MTNYHFIHHIIPRHKRGSDGPENRIGLCDHCHHLVHIGELDIDAVGMEQKYAALSVLNQAIPYIYQGLVEIFGEDHVHVCQGYETQVFRDLSGLEKDHDADAVCIAALGAGIETVSVKNADCHELIQFRRHDRSIINNQRERSYKLPQADEKGRVKYKTIAKNRRPREEQKGPALSQWFTKICQEQGLAEAVRLRSVMRADRSRRYKNALERTMPGALFRYHGKVYVLTGQLNNGQYYRAFGHGSKNFPAKHCRIIKHNSGLVYV